jgi:hypothetical protein
MAIVIGAATIVQFVGACVVSASWGYNPNPQRLFCLGEWTPRTTLIKPTRTLNLVVYSPGPSYSTQPTTSCTDANRISASIAPAACGGSFPSMSGSWWVTGYSFSKDDAQMPGQESWSLTDFKAGSGNENPTYVLRGISDGQGTPNAGITFTGSTIESSSGSVSAGGFGQAYEILTGVVSRVGGGDGSVGTTGTGNVSIPYTPLYI